MTCPEVWMSYLLLRNDDVVYRLLIKGLELLDYVQLTPNINGFM